jgi:hypothetical protein
MITLKTIILFSLFVAAFSYIILVPNPQTTASALIRILCCLYLGFLSGAGVTSLAMI